MEKAVEWSSSHRPAIASIRKWLAKFKHTFFGTSFRQDSECWNHFYRSFEDRFRGSKQDIAATLHDRYAARLTQLRQSRISHATAIDLGCGRGELTTLLHSCGFAVTGVDQSTAMLDATCPSKKIQLISSDLLDFLAKQPAEQSDFISLIHVIEHCPPQYTFNVFRQAFRCLAPGGVLLIETPSAVSLWSAARQFCLDPTHQMPVHPEYIKFMSEHLGFSTCDILKFARPQEEGIPQLAASLNGSSAIEAAKMESWLYGELDVAAWITK